MYRYCFFLIFLQRRTELEHEYARWFCSLMVTLGWSKWKSHMSICPFNSYEWYSHPRTISRFSLSCLVSSVSFVEASTNLWLVRWLGILLIPRIYINLSQLKGRLHQNWTIYPFQTPWSLEKKSLLPELPELADFLMLRDGPKLTPYRGWSMPAPKNWVWSH